MEDQKELSSVRLWSGSDPVRSRSCSEGLGDAGLAADVAEITMRASVSTELDASGAASMIKLLEVLEDLDDVQTVHSNAEIPDEILAEL